MTARFRCLKCLKIIECAPYDRAVLLDHLRTDHPEILLDDKTQFNIVAPPPNSEHIESSRSTLIPEQPVPEPLEMKLPPVASTMEEETIRSPGHKPVFTRKYKIYTPLTPKSPQKRRLYKTSIEKWRPAKGTIYCPKCGASKRPTIRSRSERMSYSTVGAACMLTCWPLCFLPCLFPAPQRHYLHCAECNYFLGMYDKARNCVRPNREFADVLENREQQATNEPTDANQSAKRNENEDL